MTKEEIKQWLISDRQISEGCENNEYWNHWYDVIHRMMQQQGQALPLVGVSQQREQLIDFGKEMLEYQGNYPNDKWVIEKVDQYLSN